MREDKDENLMLNWGKNLMSESLYYCLLLEVLKKTFFG